MKIETQSETEKLTPESWKHVGVYSMPGSSLYELRGRCHSMPWFPADLHALGLDPNVRTRRIKKLEAAIAIGQQIEDAMEARVPGQSIAKRRSEAVAPVSPDETGLSTVEPCSDGVGLVAMDETSLTTPEQRSSPVGLVGQAQTAQSTPEQRSEAVAPVGKDETRPSADTPGSVQLMAKLMEGKKKPAPEKASLPPAFLAPLPDPKQPELF